MQTAPGPATTRARGTGFLRAILHRRDFRRLLGVRLFSQLGDGVLQASLAGSVFFNPERAASPVAIATAFAVLLVPYSTLGPFVGVFLDRWSRRQVLFVASAARAALVAVCASMVWRGDAGGAFVGVALAIIALNRFFLAGLSAAQPHVVEPHTLVTANSFATTAGTVCYSGALALAGAAFQLTGTGFHPYALIAATAIGWYGLSATLVLVSFPVGALGPDHAMRPSGSVLAGLADTARGMVAGLAHLARRRAAWSVVVVQGVHRGLYGVGAMMTLLLYKHTGYYGTGDPADAVSGLLPVAAAAALGALLAAVVTPAVTRRVGGPVWVVVLVGGLAVLLPPLGLPFLPALTVLLVGLISVATQGLKIVVETTLQLHCEDDYRGRVFSVNDTAQNLLFVAGLFVAAIALPVDGYAPAAVPVVAGIYAVLALWYAWTRLIRAGGQPVLGGPAA
jgi:hypothetical protein